MTNYRVSFHVKSGHHSGTEFFHTTVNGYAEAASDFLRTHSFSCPDGLKGLILNDLGFDRLIYVEVEEVPPNPKYQVKGI